MHDKNPIKPNSVASFDELVKKNQAGKTQEIKNAKAVLITEAHKVISEAIIPNDNKWQLTFHMPTELSFDVAKKACELINKESQSVKLVAKRYSKHYRVF